MKTARKYLSYLLLFIFFLNLFVHLSYLKEFNKELRIETSLAPSVKSSEDAIEESDIEILTIDNLIVDDNFNRVDDALEKKRHFSVEPVRILVFFNHTANLTVFESFIEQKNLSLISSGKYPFPFYSFNSTSDFIQEIVENFDGILGIKEDCESSSNMVESLRNVGVFPAVHADYGLKGDSNMSVAVLDRGVDDSHPALSGSLIFWKDFSVNNYSTPTDPVGHGTAVSSLIIGRPFNTTDGVGRQVVSNVENYDWPNSILEKNKEYIWYTGGYNITAEGEISYTASWSRKDSITGVEILKYCITTNNGTYLANVSSPLQNTNYTVSFNLTQEHLGIIKVGYVFRRINDTTYSSYILHSETHIPFNYTHEHTNFTGVAPNVNLVGLRVVYESDILQAIEWLLNNSKSFNIAIACMSFGINSNAVHIAVRSLVEHGIVVVAAAGNEINSTNLAGSLANTPGSVAEAISVGATTNNNSLTSYSANGGVSISGNTSKPDIVAPGGEFSYKYESTYPLLLPDSNHGDFIREIPQGINNPLLYDLLPDRFPNDLAYYSGTSFSAPIVAGAALLMMETDGGMDSWQYKKPKVMEIKARLLMTAAETGQSRLFYPSMSPSVDRGGKDVHEGYGLLNVKAAVDTYRNQISSNSSHSGYLTSPKYQIFNISNVWAARMNFRTDKYYDFILTTNSSADFDIYIYEANGNQYGDPILLDKKATIGLGLNESMRFNVDSNKTAIITVKCLNGSGDFQLDIIEYPDYSAPNSISIINDLSGKFYSQIVKIQPAGIDLGTGIRIYEVFGQRKDSNDTYRLIYRFNATQSIDVPVQALDDGYYNIYLKAIDGAGNYNFSETKLVAIDNTSPYSVSFIEPNDYYLRAYGDFYLIIDAKDGFSGIQTVYILDYRTRAIFSAVSKEDGPYVFLWRSRLKDDGDWYILGSAVDKAGNFKDTAYGITINIVNQIEQQRTLSIYLSVGVVSLVLLYYVSKYILLNVNLDEIADYFRVIPYKIQSKLLPHRGEGPMLR